MPELKQNFQILHDKEGHVAIKQTGWVKREKRMNLKEKSGSYTPKGKGGLNIQIKDLSIGGIKIFIVSKTLPLEIGSTGKVSFTFGIQRRGEFLADQQARVLWENNGFYGLQFIAIEESTVEIIKNFIG